MTRHAMHNYKYIVAAVLYLLFAPPALAAVKDTLHDSLSSYAAWDLLYNVIGAAGGGIVLILMRLFDDSNYTPKPFRKLWQSAAIGAFGGLLTYLFVAGTDIVSVNSMQLLGLSCAVGVSGGKGIEMYMQRARKELERDK